MDLAEAKVATRHGAIAAVVSGVVTVLVVLVALLQDSQEGALAAIPLIGVLALVLTSGLGMTPVASVVSGDEPDSGVVALLRETGILYEDESIELLYFFGLTTYLAGGSIISDRAVISYFGEPTG